MISKFRIYDQNCAASVFVVNTLHPTIAAQQHLVLLYSGRKAYIFVRSRLKLTGKSITVLKSVSRLTTI